MTAGIRIISDQGTIQIDETYRNLFVRVAGVGGTIPAQASDLCAMIPTTITGDNYRWGNPVTSTTKWWLFAVLTGTATARFGLQIRDAAGNRIFDTSQQPLRIVDVLTITNLTAGSKAYPAGRQYAVVPGGSGWKTLKESTTSGAGHLWTNTTTKYRFGFRVSSNTVYWDWYVWNIDGPWPGEDQSIGNSLTVGDTPATFLVVDVTGY
jgi:hypothetical protein